jgi:subtilisin family serine protease/subtilisin-like proprotein convertase family protein
MNKKRFVFSSISLSVMLALTGCGSDSKKNKPEIVTEVKKIQAQNVLLSGIKNWLPEPFQLRFNNQKGTVSVHFFEGDTKIEPEGGVYTFSHGVITKTDQGYSYTSLHAENVEIGYQVSSGNESAKALISVNNVLSDPLTKEQWHLNNTGQTSYALSNEFKEGLTDYAEFSDIQAENFINLLKENNTKIGEDINVLNAYQQGATGEGMIAVVVDTGLQLDHPDIINNALPGRSLDLAKWAIDRTNPNDNGEGHGTSVSGIIAAEGWNNEGGRGIAPNTKLIGMRYLQPSLPKSNLVPYFENIGNSELAAHGYLNSGIKTDENIAVFNRSYGPSRLTRIIPYFPISEEVESYPARQLRSGKGALNIKAAGNDFNWCGINSELTCTNANFDRSQSHPFYQTIGAINANGEQSSYSSNGANLLLSAPAGEDGIEAPGIVTSDIKGCLDGSSYYQDNIRYISGKLFDTWGLYQKGFGGIPLSIANPFNFSAIHLNNPNCDYTNNMNGTSAAAPMVSGVVALILSANPELNWREVRDILIRTADRNDPEDAKVSLNVGETGSYEAHSGWVKNSADLWFNNRYGFGRVNAGNAVEMAKNYSNRLPEFVVNQWQVVSLTSPLIIPDNDANGISYTFTIDEAITIEAIRLKLDIANLNWSKYSPAINWHEAINTAGVDLALELISPSGTKSILLSSQQAILHPEKLLADYPLADATLMTNAFYNEPAKGTWTVRFIDTNGDELILKNNKILENNLNNSQVEAISVQVYGHSAQ